jgi:hypothetical protein
MIEHAEKNWKTGDYNVYRTGKLAATREGERDKIIIPVGSARSLYSLFKSKVPLTYSTRVICELLRIFRRPKPT